MNTTNKSEIIADIQNKLQLPKIILEMLDQGKSVSQDQIGLCQKELDQAERLLKLLEQ